MSFVQMKKDNKERPDGKPCLLVHGFDSTGLKVVNKMALALDIDEVIDIKTTMQNNVIQDIIDGKATENALLSPIDESVVIFNDLSEHDIHEFISAFKGTGLKRPIYAASTVHSRKWTFKTWLTELMEERAEMAKQEKIRRAMKK